MADERLSGPDKPSGQVSEETVIEAFKELSLNELSGFVKTFEETFDVTAAAPVRTPAYPAPDAMHRSASAGRNDQRMRLHRSIAELLGQRFAALSTEVVAERSHPSNTGNVEEESTDPAGSGYVHFLELFHEFVEQRVQQLSQQTEVGQKPVSGHVDDGVSETRDAEDPRSGSSRIDEMGNEGGISRTRAETPSSGVQGPRVKRYEVRLKSRGKTVYVDSLARKRFLEAADRLATPLL